ncbi:hypothetical protein E5288_WYG019460 [Bos mutus]|uniref:Uncharacterized protein n=1 Tax=Bos mutus TaxID=72004 RepID=A0A6B0S528_9CETA|nr:hypothetical protein [Bos mutus]
MCMTRQPEAQYTRSPAIQPPQARRMFSDHSEGAEVFTQGSRGPVTILVRKMTSTPKGMCEVAGHGIKSVFSSTGLEPSFIRDFLS